MSRAHSATVSSVGGSTKKHTTAHSLTAAGDFFSQEDEYARLNRELEARTATLLQDAESVLKHNEALLADQDDNDANGDYPLEGATGGLLQFDDDVENNGDVFGDKYEYLPSEEEDLGLEEQLTGKKTSVPEINSTINQRPISAKNAEKSLHSRPGSKRSTDKAKSQPSTASGRRSAGGSRADTKSKADFVATPSEAAATALKKTIARIEQDDSVSACTPSAIDVNPDIGVASELGSEAANRFLKAKLRVLQEEMDRLAHDSNKKDQENYKLQQRLKEAEEERNKLQKASQTHLSQMEKMKKMLDESKRKADSADSQMTVLKKELEALKRDAGKQTSGKSVTEVRLNRALEEVEKYKSQLSKLNQNSKETMDSERKRMDQLVAENKKLEKQKAELIAGFKKQLKLIDLLKRQKMHLEAAKLLHFTEEEFIKALDLGS